VSDAELVERARTGDQSAFGELVEIHQPAVFRAALAALRSRDEAEEVVQDAFLAAYRKLGDFRGESSFKTWLLTITWRKALDRRRSIGEWMSRFVTPSDHDAPPLDPPSPDRSHEQSLIDDDLRRHVRRMVRTLPAHFRDVLLLMATGDHTFEEIGKMLGVPLGTVKWRASEGRRLLKRKLARLGYGDA
jgi:RNA polymerase sigma-70 factor (ECF subfamily)